ncbi:methyltransferase domain-containing protein [Hirschia litorea]|uniref:Methyltransferase domain-containing protein n=1 Tax=Hirschia litorea TaxID=1199156 RepID=A0ABW2IJJ6_9PROT
MTSSSKNSNSPNAPSSASHKPDSAKLAPPTTQAIGAPVVFDRRLVKKHRNRAAKHFKNHDFIKKRAAEDLADRLDVVPRPFDLILDLGAHSGEATKEIRARKPISDRVETIISTDLSPNFISAASGLRAAADEEFLPFKPFSFDAVISSLSLHWVNDLPGTLMQIRNVLKPDGLFIGQMLGGKTLNELRTCLIEAETEIRGGAAMRISPFADIQDMSSLLQRAGFVMPVADTETVKVRYSNPFTLFNDLRGMGETSAPATTSQTKKSPNLTRTILFRALEIYSEKFTDKDGKYLTTFEIITASGWSPGPDQPQPLRRGSAKASLAEALGSVEQKSPR